MTAVISTGHIGNGVRPIAGFQAAGWIESFWLPAFEPSRILFVYADKLDQVFDSEVGECLDAIFFDAINADDAVLNLHLTGDVSQPVFVCVEVPGDTGDGFDAMNLVDVHSHTARAESAAG